MRSSCRRWWRRSRCCKPSTATRILRRCEGFACARAALALAAHRRVAACSGGAPHRTEALYDPRALPTGPVGDSIAYGCAIMVQTHRADEASTCAPISTCADCHIAAGTQPRGGSFIGTYARFPQWNKRAQRVIALQDRIAECFLYSMNGRPPAYNSKPMIAIVAYIAWLSRGTPIGAKQPAGDRYIEPLPSARRRSRGGARGSSRDKCAHCHRSRRRRAFEVPIRRCGASDRSTTVRGMAHHRSDDRVRALQYAARCAGLAIVGASVRRRRIRASPPPPALPKGRPRARAAASGEVLLAPDAQVVGPRPAKR